MNEYINRFDCEYVSKEINNCEYTYIVYKYIYIRGYNASLTETGQ